MSNNNTPLKLPKLPQRNQNANPICNRNSNLSSIDQTLHKIDLLSAKKHRKKNVQNNYEIDQEIFEESSLFSGIQLKKALGEAFDADPNSYLGSLQEAAAKFSNPNVLVRNIPATLIPREYFVYSKSPIAYGLIKDGTEHVISNEDGNEWQTLVFPSHKPSKRVEIYLLAKTMDEMLAKMNEEEKKPILESDYFDIKIERIKKSFKIHIAALFEIYRQVFSTCTERGIMLQKIYSYFSEFFESIMSLLQDERKKCLDFQNIINDYENLMKELVIERERNRKEMEELLKENNNLFKEKEEYRLKVVNIPKYDLVLKILKNKKTWENFLRENSYESEKQHMALSALAGGALGKDD